MPSFQHFQNQAEQKSQKSKFSNDVLSLSIILQYAENAKKQSFEALCRIQPLVKTYRDKVDETSQAMKQAETSLENEAEIPEAYSAALTLVKKSFEAHLQALADWMNVLTQKNEPEAERALAKVQQSGQQLETALGGLSVAG